MTPANRRQPPSRDDLARSINRPLVIVMAVSGVASLAIAALAVLLDGPLLIQGGALAAGLLTLSFAVQQWRTAALPYVELAKVRVVRGERVRRVLDGVSRRSVLRSGVFGGAVVLGLGLMGLLGWLGPRRQEGTHWREGVHLVTSTGDRIRAGEVPTGGLATVWPENSPQQESSAAILVRLSEQTVQPPTVTEWVVAETLVAYSKVCTHAGCPVGLFRERDGALFCPCHQATFDSARGAVPTFGPAAKALPQLPIGVDGDGFLIALGDFAAQVGPVTG